MSRVAATRRPDNHPQGVYPGFAPSAEKLAAGATPGLEGAGVVEDGNGTGVENGTRCIVFFNTKEGQGSWQQYVAVPATNIIPVPDSVPDEAAAQVRGRRAGGRRLRWAQ